MEKSERSSDFMGRLDVPEGFGRGVLEYEWMETEVLCISMSGLVMIYVVNAFVRECQMPTTQ